MSDTEAWTRALMMAVAKGVRFRTYLESRVSIELPFTDMERMVGDVRSIYFIHATFKMPD